MKQSHLHGLHQGNGAAFVERDGWLLPDHFGDSAAEYDAVRTRAGWLDLAGCAVLEVSGADSVEWLQGMLSNDVRRLDDGDGAPAAVLNIQGKILADVRVLRTANGFLVLLDEPLAAAVVKHLNRYLIADEVEIADLSAAFSVLSIQGPQAGASLERVLAEIHLGNPSVTLQPQASAGLERVSERDAPAAAMLPEAEGARAGGAARSRSDGRGMLSCAELHLSHAEVERAGGRVRVVRASHTGEPGFDLVAARDHLQQLAGLPAARTIPWIGLRAQETLRIEAGIPLYGTDMDADTLLLETCLDGAVSFTKGCYLGQETVERIHSRGRVNRKLTGLKMAGDEAPDAGAPILDRGRAIGRLTSVTASPRLGCAIALGYVHRDYLEPGTAVVIEHRGRTVRATVQALPF